jgi:cbb3-type cytochrome oxidase maturation protein
MEVLILTVFVSLMLVAGELIFFAWNLRHGTHDHTDRLSLLPLEDERPLHDAPLDRDGKKGN